jgi:hypothetical protein
METSKEILTELLEIAPILGKGVISRILYAVPNGYFEGFAESLMNRIRMEETGLSESDAGQQNAEVSPLLEIAEISSLLAGLKKKNTYQVPVGYFESLNLGTSISEQKPSEKKTIQAPVISLKSMLLQPVSLRCWAPLYLILLIIKFQIRSRTFPL